MIELRILDPYWSWTQTLAVSMDWMNCLRTVSQTSQTMFIETVHDMRDVVSLRLGGIGFCSWWMLFRGFHRLDWRVCFDRLASLHFVLCVKQRTSDDF